MKDEVQIHQLDSNLLNSTEVLRQKLIKLYCKEGSFSNERVVKMSQELDEYIVKAQRDWKINGCRAR
ncbi:aspartyl-phosphate phosphatase Spo0E family protein [Brevibacillus laterosporus]|uniref:aspartyl-phosphate phosphatase Spo0E family protein n=1 Tax=Brevibacillus laterosporus TaxID=1465 RepID=UPI001A7E2471|nr:aspartyl-phosphate phosphatase Spo0E family protein [Brevibacillus laterosporus]